MSLSEIKILNINTHQVSIPHCLIGKIYVTHSFFFFFCNTLFLISIKALTSFIKWKLNTHKSPKEK